nr:MAG TPA: hypothetical protein [Caudoviricetes sp.]
MYRHIPGQNTYIVHYYISPHYDIRLRYFQVPLKHL